MTHIDLEKRKNKKNFQENITLARARHHRPKNQWSLFKIRVCKHDKNYLLLVNLKLFHFCFAFT